MSRDDTAAVADHLRILTPGLTPEEIAAVTAVVVATIEELAEAEPPVHETRRDAWRPAVGAKRVPLHDRRGGWSTSLR